jgi:transcriptional regulator with XRE-family HTH domain
VNELAAGGIKRTQEWLSKVERGTRTLSAPDAQALAQVLGVAAGHLLGDQDVTGNDLGARLRALEDDLTDRDKEELLQIARLKAELNREAKQQSD